MDDGRVVHRVIAAFLVDPAVVGAKMRCRRLKLTRRSGQPKNARIEGGEILCERIHGVPFGIDRNENGIEAIRVGSEPRVADGNEDSLVLPLRMPAPVGERMDEARRRLGLASRAERFRRALHRYFVDSGEREVADFLLLRGDGAGAGAGAAPISEAKS